MAHSRGQRLVRSPRRSMLWSEGPRVVAVSSFSAAGKTAWNIGQNSGGGVTIVRIRGGFTAWLELVTALGDGFSSVAAGIGIVSADAFAVGSTAMPGPLSDPEWDWMWINYFGAMVGSTVTEEFKGLAAVRQVIDTKAMRKVQPNEVVFGMVESEVEIGAATVTFAAATRMLVKLG